VTTAAACVLGCTNSYGLPYPAAPGRLACAPCETRLMGVLGDLADRYATLQTADALIPGGHGDTGGARRQPGPRSPAVDALIVHSDIRTRWTSEHGYGALAVIESWARMIREETGAQPPAGRARMDRELHTIRFHWDHIMRSRWVDEFAREVQEASRALTNAGRLTERVLRVGPCPGLVDAGTAAVTGETVYRVCGETLLVRASAEEIRCRACGTAWPRSRWNELGDQWADYALLAHDLGVPVTTLRRWASEDEQRGQAWAKERRGRRNLVSRIDALAAAARRGKAVA
jgi:hypothetical protein